MTLIADILMISGALGAAFYCMMLSRRLSRFTDLDKGIGGAIAVLSMQVDDMTKTLKTAQEAAGASSTRLDAMTERGEEIAKRLELLVASMHDLPVPAAEPEPAAEPNATATDTRPEPKPGEAHVAAPKAAGPQAPVIFSSQPLSRGGAAA